ncbi:hypothetical protein ATKI12_8193 [Kitasatospora sp. Ki12]
MNLLQLKPYLEARKLGTTLRIGHVPPSGTEILDAPGFLTGLIAMLSAPTERGTAVGYLAETAGLTAEAAEELIDQLVDAEIVGAPIPSDGRYARHLLYYDMIGLEHENVELLGQAGFQRVDCFWRWMNFAGWIAVKTG